MKKAIIAVAGGAIILFLYQALSWTVLPVHTKTYTYTIGQDSIMKALSNPSRGLKDDVYYLPSARPGASKKEQHDIAKSNNNLPWAILYYHPNQHIDMTSQMLVGFLLDLVIAIITVWVVRRMRIHNIASIFFCCLAIGVIITCNTRLMDWNWWQQPMHHVSGDIIDLLVSWALLGLWLGLILGRKPKAQAAA